MSSQEGVSAAKLFAAGLAAALSRRSLPLLCPRARTLSDAMQGLRIGGAAFNGIIVALLLASCRLCRSQESADPPARQGAHDAPPALLALCLNGDLSVQLQCLKRALFVANTLNRTLIVADVGRTHSHTLEAVSPIWHWDNAVDFTRMTTCLAVAGQPGAMPLHIFLQQSAPPLTTLEVPTVLCLAQEALRPCFSHSAAAALHEHLNGALKFSESPALVALAQAPEQGVSSTDIERSWGSLPDRVVALGDEPALPLHQEEFALFGANWTMGNNCTNLWRPHASIMKFVKGILDIFMGSHYAAIFWERSPVVISAEGQPVHKVESVLEVASRLRASLKNMNISLLYLSSDLGKEDLQELEDLLKDRTQETHVAFVMSLKLILEYTDWLKGEFWSKEAMKMEDTEKNGVAMALIDKFLCAYAEFFVSSPSKYANDIVKIRHAEGFRNPPEIPEILNIS